MLRGLSSMCAHLALLLSFHHFLHVFVMRSLIILFPSSFPNPVFSFLPQVGPFWLFCPLPHFPECLSTLQLSDTPCSVSPWMSWLFASLFTSLHDCWFQFFSSRAFYLFLWCRLGFGCFVCCLISRNASVCYSCLTPHESKVRGHSRNLLL